MLNAECNAILIIDCIHRVWLWRAKGGPCTTTLENSRKIQSESGVEIKNNLKSLKMFINNNLLIKQANIMIE